MNVLGYTIEVTTNSLQPITHFKIHKRETTKHLVWWKLSVLYGPTLFCEECDAKTGLDALCENCFEHFYCECGKRLEDSYGSPGDGLCVVCR